MNSNPDSGVWPAQRSALRGSYSRKAHGLGLGTACGSPTIVASASRVDWPHWYRHFMGHLLLGQPRRPKLLA